MNAFDLVVTVALGSTLATLLLNKNVALVEGATALLVLVLLQFSITWLAARFGWWNRLAKMSPRCCDKISIVLETDGSFSVIFRDRSG